MFLGLHVVMAEVDSIKVSAYLVLLSRLPHPLITEYSHFHYNNQYRIFLYSPRSTNEPSHCTGF